MTEYKPLQRRENTALKSKSAPLNTPNKEKDKETSIDSIIHMAVMGIAQIQIKERKKGIYDLCEDVCQKIKDKVDLYERNRIKQKIKARKEEEKQRALNTIL